MPTQWTLELTRAPERPMGRRFDVLHAIACSVFERQDSRHDDGEKNFTIRTDPNNGRRLTLTWLDDRTGPPASHPLHALQVGDEKIPVTVTRQKITGYDEIETAPVVTDLTLSVHTPALFKHNNHNYPLPDPYVMFSSLARRYQAYRPETGQDSETVRELGRSVMVTEHRIRTERFSWHGRIDSGFAGQIGLRLMPRAAPGIRRAYTTLGLFAGIAGIGRGTTHGLGATSVGVRRVTADSGTARVSRT